MFHGADPGTVLRERSRRRIAHFPRDAIVHERLAAVTISRVAGDSAAEKPANGIISGNILAYDFNVIFFQSRFNLMFEL